MAEIEYDVPKLESLGSTTDGRYQPSPCAVYSEEHAGWIYNTTTQPDVGISKDGC